MPTGGGKSLCYQLPALAGGGLVLVVSPLIALMADQLRRLQEVGVPACMLASGMGEGHNERSLAEIREGHVRLALVGARALLLGGLPGRAGGHEGGAVRRRRGSLRDGVGTRLPPRLPASARRDRGTGPPAGDGPHGDRDAPRGGGDRATARAERDPSRCAPASIARTSPSTSWGWRGRARWPASAPP